MRDLQNLRNAPILSDRELRSPAFPSLGTTDIWNCTIFVVGAPGLSPWKPVPSPFPTCNNQKCPQTLPNVPWGTGPYLPQLRASASDRNPLPEANTQEEPSQDAFPSTTSCPHCLSEVWPALDGHRRPRKVEEQQDGDTGPTAQLEVSCQGCSVPTSFPHWKPMALCLTDSREVGSQPPTL